jgi:molybdopterin biosynthesis enzyme
MAKRESSQRLLDAYRVRAKPGRDFSLADVANTVFFVLSGDVAVFSSAQLRTTGRA